MLLFSRKLKLSICTSFWQAFSIVLFANIQVVSLSHWFYVNVCSAIKREEIWKQVACERKRLTLYVNNTKFPVINMQYLQQSYFITYWMNLVFNQQRYTKGCIIKWWLKKHNKTKQKKNKNKTKTKNKTKNEKQKTKTKTKQNKTKTLIKPELWLAILAI